MNSENLPKIPNYQIDCKIGRGGMAIVYKGQHVNLDRPVAIKLLRPEAIANPRAIRRFFKEPKILARFNHPNIVKIYDSGYVDPDKELLYIAMQYLPGGSLTAKMRHGQLSLPRIIEIIKLIAGALVVAHSKGVIHRDIKPENILFQENGEPVLTDFGIAKDLTNNIQTTTLGTLLGTYRYMSPEQFQGKQLDNRSDLYSLGIVLFEMLSGQRPYDGDDIEMMITRRLTEPVPSLPKEFAVFQPIIEKLLTKEINDRFDSANELIKALEKVEEKLECSSRKFSISPSLAFSVNRRIKQYIASLQPTKDYKVLALHPAKRSNNRSYRLFTRITVAAVASAAILVVPALHTLSLQVGGIYRVAEDKTTNTEWQTEALQQQEKTIQNLRSAIAAIEHETAQIRTEYEQRSEELENKVLKLKELQIQLRTEQENYQNHLATIGSQQPFGKQHQSQPLTGQSINAADAQLMSDIHQTNVQQAINNQTVVKPHYIRGLLDQAEAAFAKKAFTTPKDDNAIKWAQQILELDPNNQQAVNIIERVVDAYLALAQTNYLGRMSQWLERAHPLADFFSPQQHSLFAELQDKSTRIRRTSARYRSGNSVLGAMESHQSR